MERRSEPGTDGWAELREAQALTAQNVANCGLAVTVDTGDADNIHPKNKVPVGDRLAEHRALARLSQISGDLDFLSFSRDDLLGILSGQSVGRLVGRPSP